MNRETVRRRCFVLLSLLGSGGCNKSVVIDEGDWRHIDRMAAAHRLQPYLYGRIIREELSVNVPAAIRANWKEAHRTQALVALAQQRALFSAGKVLADVGLAPIALKGAWLAWHAYHAPAERPMRDIDLLVEPDEALYAFERLEAAGWDARLVDHSSLQEIAAKHRHLPPMRNADGVWLELHGRAWDSGFETAQDRLRRRAVASAPVLYPHPHDMLVHLAIHAGPAHGFNVGPLILSDIACLIEKAIIDWAEFWDDARKDGTERPVALVLALVNRWLGLKLPDEAFGPTAVPQQLIDDVSDLLLQEPAARKDIALLAGLRSPEPGNILNRLGRRLSFDARDVATGRIEPRARRFVKAGKAFLNTDTRRSAAETARVSAWLEGG
ncbi:hypothetical protein GRI38_08740 [Altererythrobacter aurantiacus]|uniref:Nucleotidyltransferase n=1 Tax=Parapontixanthobacter aurantiacus TaxID=1463599 RepID=A0A844ZFK9_9SPHN|nr:nucleotidyltransferase family protein [Parapontixanthobacter aurantiacus]MXO86113.1 hypothetical protein [Parapontixanthobacter aurantiacus]